MNSSVILVDQQFSEYRLTLRLLHQPRYRILGVSFCERTLSQVGYIRCLQLPDTSGDIHILVHLPHLFYKTHRQGFGGLIIAADTAYYSQFG